VAPLTKVRSDKIGQHFRIGHHPGNDRFFRESASLLLSRVRQFTALVASASVSTVGLVRVLSGRCAQSRGPLLEIAEFNPANTLQDEVRFSRFARYRRE
jgi:hypothetical protein